MTVRLSWVMANWSDSEVSLLIELWGEECVQEQLEGAKRNKHVYAKIVKQMQVRDSSKTAEQCRAKMKKLKLEYRKIKDNHNKTGRGRKNWKFLEAMEAILHVGHRRTTKPSVLLDTSENQDEQESDLVDELEEDEKVVCFRNRQRVLQPVPLETVQAPPKTSKHHYLHLEVQTPGNHQSHLRLPEGKKENVPKMTRLRQF